MGLGVSSRERQRARRAEASAAASPITIPAVNDQSKRIRTFIDNFRTLGEKQKKRMRTAIAIEPAG
jgi:hypothetical protein